MKKVAALVLALGMLAALCACGGESGFRCSQGL